MNPLMTILKKAKDVTILVIGDIVLDRYIYGTVDRICEAAPVPVVNIDKVKWHLGGAANSALNVQALGAKALLIGKKGNHPEYGRIKEQFSAFDHYVMLGKNDIKTRIIANGQQLLRFDEETIEPVPFEDYEDIVKGYLEKADAVLISDYGKGMVSKELMEGVKEKTITIVDPFVGHYDWYYDCCSVTPNDKQYWYMITKQFDKQHYCNAVLITKGNRGLSLMVYNENSHLYEQQSICNPLNVKAKSIVGAGDVATAAFTVALATGASYKDAAEFANICAGIAVQYEGTCVTRKEEVGKWIKQME